jgi:arginase family enzyme
MLTRLGRALVQAQRSYSTRIGIVGVPLEEGQNKVGVANGPDAIRKANLIERIKSIRK